MAKLLYYFPFICLLPLVVRNKTINIVVTQKNYDNLSYLDPGITKSCPENDTMFIKGNDVQISDFVRENGEIYNLCSYKTDLKYIYVFALNSLVIDMDVDTSSSNLQLFLIAPSWIVVGSRKISVDGSKGSYIPQASDGNDTSIDGQDGKPGHPGGPGGNIFIIGESFANGKRLTITANGGIGGTGQYGGNGYSQIKGRYVDTNALGKIWCGLYYDICRGKEKPYQLNLLDNYGIFSDFYCLGLYEEENMERCSYKIFGWEGAEGGKGGNGGRGGNGGFPGNIKLLDLKGFSKISTYNILGIYGKNGKGGTGGKSGQDGHNVIYEDVYFMAPPKIKFELGQEYNYHFGPNGSDGYNSVGLEDAIEADFLNPSEVLSSLNEYKKWVRQSSGNIKNSNIFVEFYKSIDRNSYVRDLYNTSEFLSEVQSIDEEFIKLKSVDFSPFYDSLLERIFYYADKRVEDKQILSLLYTETLGRIYNFNEHAETYLVIEIPPYLNLVKINLQKVSSLVESNSTFDQISDKLSELNEYKENYEDQVYKLITKFRQHVDIKLIMETEALVKDESNKISELLKDIIRFKRRPLNYEQELLRWGKKFEISLIVTSHFYFIRKINGLLNTLSDFAEIVSSVVEIGAQVPEVLRLREETTTQAEFSPETFKNLSNKFEAIKAEEVTSITMLLQNVLNTTKTHEEILFDMSEEVLTVQRKLHNNNRFISISALRSDLLKAVEIKLEELSPFLHLKGNTNSKASEHITNAQLAFADLNRIKKIASISRGFFVDLYNDYKHDNDKLDTIIEYINKVSNTLHAGKKNEDGMYIVIYQLLQRMEDVITAASENPDKVPKLATEIMKWNIPLILANIKHRSQQFTGNNEAKAYLTHIIENLGGACSAFTGVFERMQNYLQQKQLENYIADSTFAINKEIEFTNDIFTNKYDSIKKGFGSNLVLQHYKKAADTFKHYVYPLADVYFKDIILPSHFNIYDDIANTVSVAITQIDKMLEKVEHYKDSMLNGDGIMERKNYGSRYIRSANPFFMWTNDQYKDIIEKLLSGEEVTVNADISKSNISDHAVKFNRIDFYFSSKDESIQERVNYIMGEYEVYVTHMGNSHYRYNNDLYLITSDSLEIRYGFEMNEDTGIPETLGGAYAILMNVDITLSPYATWKIRLISIYEEDSFDSLSEFKGNVDLELGGNAYFISKEKISTLDLKVTKFYKPL